MIRLNSLENILRSKEVIIALYLLEIGY